VEANNKHEIAYLELGFCSTIFMASAALPSQPIGKLLDIHPAITSVQGKWDEEQDEHLTGVSCS